MIYRSDLQRSVKLFNDLYFYAWQGRGNNCNSILFPNVLRSECPHVIVDAGATVNESGEACLEALGRAMEKDGFEIKETGLVINTHYHTDHYAGSEAIARKSGALIAMTKEDQEWGRTLSSQVYAAFGVDKPEYQPSFYLKEGRLELGKDGKVKLEVIVTPGHSPGSVCLYWAERKVLISGDVVFAGSIGRTDFPGGSLVALKQSLDRLSELDVEHLLPGHSTEMGSMISGRQAVKRNFQMVKTFF